MGRFNRIEWNGKSFAVKKRAPKLIKQEPTWEFLVGFIRGSKESRRDTDFLTNQNKFLQWQVNKLEAVEKMNERRNWERWLRQTGQDVKEIERNRNFERDMRTADEVKDNPEDFKIQD